MTRRWPANLVLVLGVIAILGQAFVSGVGMAMPFSPTYRSSYGEAVTFGALIGLLGVGAATHVADRRTLERGLGILVLVAIAALAVYLPYHHAHGPVFVPDGFRGHLQRVTPFHEQLAAPVFLALGFAVVAVTVARLTRTRRPAPGQNVMTTDDAEYFAGP